MARAVGPDIGRSVGGGSAMVERNSGAAGPRFRCSPNQVALSRDPQSMLSLWSGRRIFLALEPMDLRRSFNGLSAWVQNQLQADLLGGALYIFTNRPRNRLKILFWDGSGTCLFCKRLEAGKFSWPRGSGTSISLRQEELMALISGLELREKAGWYRR